jgi:MtfA peptidase
VLGRWLRREPGRELTPAELAILRRFVPAWPHLTADEQGRLATLTGDLVDRFDWEAANRFALTDEMPVAIAGLAALLILGIAEDDPYRQVSGVVVHPGTMLLHGTSPGPSPGVVVSGPRAVQGHTTVRGPVFVAWDAVVREAASPERGESVVLHEFAHQLDMLDGVVDGTPPLPGDLRDRWIAAFTAAYEDLRRGVGRDVLRPYGTTNPGEFFAVATEAFFQRPAQLAERWPDVYDIVRDYLRQDPLARVPAPLPETSDP